MIKNISKKLVSACAEIVKQLTSELDSGNLSRKEDGESIVLLQNLLQNPIYQNLSAQQLLNLAIGQKFKNSKMDPKAELLNDGNCVGSEHFSSSPVVDSGRETPKMPRNPTVGDVGADLLEEVTAALTRLQNSLSHGEIALDETKKNALLSLVDRLHQGLVSPSKTTEVLVDSTDSGVNENQTTEVNFDQSERRGSSSGINRFTKRRTRSNRHTVGVTREELADARRIIEELEIIGMQNSLSGGFAKPKVKASHVNSNSAGVYNAILTRQISEPVTLLRPSQFLSQESLNEVNNKPYKVVLKQSISLDPSPISILKNSFRQEAKTTATTTSKAVTDDYKTKEIILQRSSSGSSKNFSRTKNKAKEIVAAEAATTDDESSTSDEENEIKTKLANKNFKARENYLRNQRSLDSSFNYSSGDEASASGPRPSKYVSKKMKMKRSNTVNLPKSYSFVNTFDLSDRDCSDVEMNQTNRKPTNAGLSTTFMGGVQPPRPPSFEPKTENDKKFLSFINKQNKDTTPTYVNPAAASKTTNWGNKFGNLKNRFENDEEPLPPKPVQKNSNAAASFWKSIEKTKPSAKVSPMVSNQVPPTVKSFPIVSEKFPWKTEKVEKVEKPPMIVSDEKIVSKKLQMLENLSKETEKIPKVNHEVNKLPSPMLKPSSVNNFTHAPMSAFKPPISRKLSNSFKPIATNEEMIKKSLPPVSNGIVKQMAENGFSQSNQMPPMQPRRMANSPTRNIASVDSAFTKVTKKPAVENQPVPWVGKPKTDHVMSLATSKFEQGVPTVHLGKTLEPAPIVKFRQNPLYNGTYEKRASLPPNASFASYEHLTSNGNGNLPSKLKDTFVITDYTPSSVSTFAPTRPTYDRQDSLTNPDKEPLVLTCDRSVFSPDENKENFEISTPSSSFVSNDNSYGDLANEIEKEVNNGVEYTAPVAKVMKGPVAHSAVVESSELVTLNGQEKENSMMKSIHDTLMKFSQKSPTPDVKRLSQDSSCSSLLDFKRSSPRIQVESRLSNDSSHSSIDSSKLPTLKIPIPAVPETAYSFSYNPSPPKIQIKSPSIDPSVPHILYNNTTNLQRTRSTNTLSVPKVGSDFSTSPSVSPVISPSKVGRVQSFFGVPSPSEMMSQKPTPSPRMKMLAARKTSSSLTRSKTMPSIAKNVELLDESNVEDAFEELLCSSNL